MKMKRFIACALVLHAGCATAPNPMATSTATSRAVAKQPPSAKAEGGLDDFMTGLAIFVFSVPDHFNVRPRDSSDSETLK